MRTLTAARGDGRLSALALATMIVAVAMGMRATVVAGAGLSPHLQPAWSIRRHRRIDQDPRGDDGQPHARLGKVPSGSAIAGDASAIGAQMARTPLARAAGTIAGIPRHGRNRPAAAQGLGVHKAALLRKLPLLGLKPPRADGEERDR